MNRRAGFTLIEVLVVLGLLSVVMIGGGALITASVRTMDRTTRQLRDPATALLMARLRRDVQESAGVVGLPPISWSQEPLILRHRDGSAVGYAWDGQALSRWTWEPDGSETPATVALPGVTAWWWRLPGGTAVDVRVAVLLSPRTIRPPAVGEAIVPERHTETWRFALRGFGGSRW